MDNAMPPGLPALQRPAWQVYLFCGAFSFPSLLVLVFNALVIFPKVKTIWRNAGLDASRAQWLLDASSEMMRWGIFSVPVIILALTVLELRTRWWPRWRTRLLAVITIAFSSFVLVTASSASVLMGLAAPTLANKARESAAKALAPKEPKR